MLQKEKYCIIRALFVNYACLAQLARATDS